MILLLGACSFACRCVATEGGEDNKQRPGYRTVLTFEALRTEFKQPAMTYAPFAFWFYDAPLDVELAARMAGEMARKGMNPGYAHARSSAAEPYCRTLCKEIPGKTPGLLPHDQWLSPLWFATLDAALGAAEQANAALGFCDDYW